MYFSLICRFNNKVHHERYNTIREAMKNGTSATHIIDWRTAKVFFPTIQDNCWDGTWHNATPDMTAACLEASKQFNPFSYDYGKIRRRIEDCLRKSVSNQQLLEIAATLKVKIN